MPDEEIHELIKRALQEDIRSGDITTDAVIPSEMSASADFLIKQDGVLAGTDIVKEVFQQIDTNIIFHSFKQDGDEVKKGEIAAEISGNAASILKGERTALNFLQRMSGIATLSRQFSDEIKHTKAKSLDTRKTAPGLRLIDKMAVRIGGGSNHRYGLFDMFLIKDNHIEASGSITNAVLACRNYQQKNQTAFKIEVETKNLSEVDEALSLHPDIIMLDNFGIDEIQKAVELINGECLIEVSGGVNIRTIRAIAETGVDYISIGALTHSVNSLDISMEIRL